MAETPVRPHLLLLTTDQHRADCLGCYGNPVVRTPHLDRLAREGVRFTRCYVQNPLCMPSRATILTGLYIRGHRVWCNGVPLPPDVPTVARTLRTAGYWTVAIGKMHFTPYGAPAQPGWLDTFDTWNEETALAAWDGDYYGFQEVWLTLGHNRPGGHYGEWLRRAHPAALALFGREAALAAPTGAPGSWKSALPVECHASTWIGEMTVQFLRRHVQERPTQPFFAWVSFPDPHHPWCPPRPYCDLYDPAAVVMPVRRDGYAPGAAAAELADKPPFFRDYYFGQMRHEGAGVPNPSAVTEAQTREIIAHTYGMITLVDEVVERILAELERLDLLEETVLCFFSDHGELLGDHGLWCKGPFHYEGLLRVPLIWRLPAALRRQRPAVSGPRLTGAYQENAGVVREELVGLVDLAPTLCDLAGLTPIRPFQGLSLVPLLTGQVVPWRQAILTEFHSGYRPDLTLKTIRTDRWKLTYYAGKPYGELYDLERDPHEFTNLFADPAYRAIREDLIRLALDLVVQTEDRWPARLAHA